MWTLRREVVLLIFVCAVAQHSATSESIVVVGAGLSGIAAAAKLIENGFDDIVILEAENRLGGRIHSVPYGEGFIDFGAQWCHGSGNNVIYDLYGTSFPFGDTGLENVDPLFLQSNGQSPNQAHCMQLAGLTESILEDEDMETYGGSVGAFFRSEYQTRIGQSPYNAIPAATTRAMLHFSHIDSTTEFASKSWDEVSARLNAQTEETDGPQFLTWNISGFKTVFSYFTENFDVLSKIQYNKEVTNINYKSSSRSVFVKCRDGSIYAANHVIFTGSLGVLKARHQTLFTPGLPSRKVKAIETTGFGTLGKVFLEFEEPFWNLDRDEFIGYTFIWTDEDFASVKASPRAWLTNLNSFIIVDGFPKLIETLVAGPYIESFEALSDAQVIDDCMWLLQKFLGRTLPRPKSMKRTKWASNKNFLGAYSFKSVAQAANNVSPADLAESIVDFEGIPKVLFAGEATDEVFSSYAHGAIQSGWRAGEELVEYLNSY